MLYIVKFKFNVNFKFKSILTEYKVRYADHNDEILLFEMFQMQLAKRQC